MSGLDNNKRQSATRRRSPPDNLDTSASQAGRLTTLQQPDPFGSQSYVHPMNG